ncbi:MAG: HEAT repeat domain-containing protein [Anaerolineae bacterium]|nr:HEAT repeat domain-containing protein [Anaerolineae bacterium]
MALFGGKPDVKQLQAKSDIRGLIKALRFKKKEDVRWQAAQALGNTAGAEKAVKPLIAALEDDKPLVRAYVAEALGKIGSAKPAVTPLCAHLHDQSPGVRKHAAASLGSIGDSAAVTPLITALKDEDDADVCANAAFALGQLGDRAAVMPIIAVLQNEDLTVRRYAAIALGELGDPAAVEPLIALLQDPLHRKERPSLIDSGMHRAVRSAAITALGRLGDAVAVPALIAEMDSDSDPDLIRAATEALIAIGDVRAVQSLLAGEHKDAVFRMGEQALPNIVAALHHEAAAGPAVEVLIGFGDVALEPVVSALETDENARFAVARVINEVNRGLNQMFWLTLCHADAPDRFSKFVATITQRVPEFEQALERAEIARLVGELEVRDRVVQQAALESLRAQGWEPIEPRHQAVCAVADGDWDAVGRLGTAALEPLVMQLLHTTGGQAEAALLHLGDEAVPLLIAALQEDNFFADKPVSGYKDRAAILLGKLADVRAVGSLVDQVAHCNQDFRMSSAQVAASALENIVRQHVQDISSENLRALADLCLKRKVTYTEIKGVEDDVEVTRERVERFSIREVNEPARKELARREKSA